MPHPDPRTRYLLLAALLLAPAPAQAEDAMEFTFQRADYRKYGLGLYQVIHATGALKDGTADKLKIFAAEHNIERGGEIYFQSRTGNRLEGMRMGRLIRQLGFKTHIGETDGATPGNCISACAFAYLGGTSRFMNANANFGLHRFYRSQGEDQEFQLQEAQSVSEQMVQYIREMGVDTRLFRYMAQPGSEEVVFLAKPTLQSLGVVNDGIFSASWQRMENEVVPYLRGAVQNDDGTHTLLLRCDRQVAKLTGEASLENPEPDALRRIASGQGVYLGTARENLAGDVSVAPGHINYTFTIPPELAPRMAASSDIGIYIQPRNIPYAAGFTIPQTPESRSEISRFINECYGREVITKNETL
jgi:hypothetical protein